MICGESVGVMYNVFMSCTCHLLDELYRLSHCKKILFTYLDRLFVDFQTDIRLNTFRNLKFQTFCLKNEIYNTMSSLLFPLDCRFVHISNCLFILSFPALFLHYVISQSSV